MIFRSPYPDVRVPDVALHRFVLAGAVERADQPALIDGPSGRALTYGQLAAGVERLAAGLTARGFRRGDVLALFMPNLPEFALAFHGTLAAGGVVTTVNSLATVQDAEYQLRNAGARFLVTVAPFLDRAAPAAAQVGIEQLFVVGEARGVTPFGALFDAGGSAPTAQPAAARDLAVLPYSSGTTGFPKGVMLTHRNLVANLIQTATVHHVVAADRIIAVLPFFHIYGMQVVMNLALWQDTECRVVDPASGSDLGPGEDGELWMRGPQVMAGYLNNPEATAATLDAAGWLHTGDIGHADPDGYFTIVDRLKELIKYKGFQVPPAELEAMLRTHPAVADAAVIPIPDEECGEVPKAFVVLRRAVPPEALLAYVAERVAPYKKIRAVEVVDAIPRSPSGKILRRVLKRHERAVRT